MMVVAYSARPDESFVVMSGYDVALQWRRSTCSRGPAAPPVARRGNHRSNVGFLVHALLFPAENFK